MPAVLSPVPHQHLLPGGQAGKAGRPSHGSEPSGATRGPDPTTDIWLLRSELEIHPVQEECSHRLENNSRDDKQGAGTHGLRLWGAVRA